MRELLGPAVEEEEVASVKEEAYLVRLVQMSSTEKTLLHV